MSSFATIARQELQQVHAELSATPLFKKYEQLLKVVALYEKDETFRASGSKEMPGPVKASRFERVAEPKRVTRGVNPDRDEALRLAAESIKGFVTPIKTSEIYDVIVQQGAKIGGTEPKSNLSAMLHHSELFRSHGRKGWTLAEYGVGDDGPDGQNDRASPEPSGNVTRHIATDLADLIGASPNKAPVDPLSDSEEFDPKYF